MLATGPLAEQAHVPGHRAAIGRLGRVGGGGRPRERVEHDAASRRVGIAVRLGDRTRERRPEPVQRSRQRRGVEREERVAMLARALVHR